MRDKNLFRLLLGLNLALAGAFLGYLLLSSHRHPKVAKTSFTAEPPKLLAVTNTRAAAPVQPPPPPTNAPAASTTNLAEHAPVPSPASNAAPAMALAPSAGPAQKRFGWQDVETDAYRVYLDNLRAVGCPEERIRYILLADIDQWTAQKRLKEAVASDPPWWRMEPDTSLAGVMREKGQRLEQERRQLIAKWLGEAVAEKEKADTPFWSHVQLTGSVLGGLPEETHQRVQEICAESMEQYQSVFWGAINAGQPLNQVNLAQLRERTRSELNKILNPEEVEEFLLRYSHNANTLRQELRGLDPSPEEFRRIFRGVDPLDHALQLEFGSSDALSIQQRERHEAKRHQIIKDVLGAQRYEAFLLTKDPLYRQAQIMASQYGAPSSAIMPIYELTKANETKRLEIMQDATLSPEQKRLAINAVYLQQQRSVQEIAAKAAGKKPGNP